VRAATPCGDGRLHDSDLYDGGGQFPVTNWCCEKASFETITPPV